MKKFSMFILAGVTVATLGFSTVSVYASTYHRNELRHNQELELNYGDHQLAYCTQGNGLKGYTHTHSVSDHANNQHRGDVRQNQGHR